MSQAPQRNSEQRSERPGNTVPTVLASLVLLVPLIVVKTLEAILKGTNPDNVDVTQGLAYLRPLLIAGIVVFVLMLVSAVLAILKVRRTDGPAAARLPSIVLGVQVVLIAVLYLVQLVVNGITGA